MKKTGEAITRRQMLGSMGGAVLGSALGAHLPSGQGQPPVHPPRHAARTSTRPNILWITAEGVPLSALGCYGSRLIETPNIDRIAREGLRFENSFTTNALCGPSRATLLTGKYSHGNGMFSNPADTTGIADSTFDARQQTLPKLLRAAGYQTGMVGKWHLPANPGEAGFDYFLFKQGAGGPYYAADGYLRNTSLGSNTIVEKSYPGYITDNVTSFAIEGMRQFTQPFFMMLQFFSAHRPFDPPHQYEHTYDGVRIPEPGTFYDDYSHRAAAARMARMRVSEMPDFHPPPELTGPQRKQWNYQQFMRHFLGTLRSQDDNVGRVLEFLDESGLSDNTIVVYTGDHGFFLGDHGWFDKRFMYEQALRVPWIIRYPGMVKPTTTSADWVVNIDNAPTVLELAGLEVPADMQGRSLVPLLGGRAPADWQRSLYYHYYEFAPPHWVFPHYGLRTDRYKLIYYYTVNEWELFDLEKDPDEMENLFLWGGFKIHPDYAAILPGLVDQLKAMRAKYQDNTGSPPVLWPAKDYD